MSRWLPLLACVALISFGASAPPIVSAAAAQTTSNSQREATRERLRTLLATAGARHDVNIAFRQSDKNPWNFVGVAQDGLANSDALEIVIQVSDSNTIAVVVYPHYQHGYINIGRAQDPAGLMHKLLNMNDHNFFYWGADDTNDVFACFNFTLESGFPEQSLLVALTSIRAQDRYVADMKPYLGAPGGQ